MDQVLSTFSLVTNASAQSIILPAPFAARRSNQRGGPLGVSRKENAREQKTKTTKSQSVGVNLSKKVPRRAPKGSRQKSPTFVHLRGQSSRSSLPRAADRNT